MNVHGIAAIYRFEMARWGRTLWQSLVTPGDHHRALFRRVRLGDRQPHDGMDGISFGAFIVPGLTLLGVFMQSIFNASFGIYFPKFTGTIYEMLSAPISSFEAVLAYVGAAATKSMILALVTLATAHLFVHVRVDHPLLMILFLVGIIARLLPVRLRDRHLGAEFRAAADHPDAGRHAPHLPRRRLLFDQGAAEPWRTITLFNPIVYLISGFRWTFFGRRRAGLVERCGDARRSSPSAWP